MRQSLLWFPEHWPISASFRAYVEAAGFDMAPCRPNTLLSADVLLLLGPIPCGQDAWISSEGVWHKYLLAKKPTLKVLQAGWLSDVQHHNYFCWSDLPSDFAAFCNNALSVTAWNPLPTYGEDLRAVWKRFKDGHNKGGFMDHFIAARRRVEIALLDLEKDDFLSAVNFLDEPATIEKFSNVAARWRQYAPLLSTSPCQQDIDAIAQNIVGLEQGWQDCLNHWMLIARMREFSAFFTNIETHIHLMEPYFKDLTL